MSKKKKHNKIKVLLLAILLAVFAIQQMVPLYVFAVGEDEEGGTSTEEPLDQEATQQNIDDMQSELNQIDEERASAEAEMANLAAQVEEKKQEVSKLNQQVEAKEEEIEKKQTEIEVQSKLIAEQQSSIEERYEGLGNRLRTIYKNGAIGFWDVLLGSASFSELMTNLDMVQLIYASDKATLEELHEVYNDLKTALDELSDMQELLMDAKDELLNEKESVEIAQAELDSAVEAVHERIHELEEESNNLAGAIYAEQQRLDAEIERLRQEAIRKAEEEAKRRAEEAARKKAEEEARRAAEEAAIKEKLDELDAKKAEIEEQITAKKEELDIANAAVDSKQAEIDERISSQTADIRLRKEELQKSMDALLVELGEIEAEAQEEDFTSTPEYEAKVSEKKAEIEAAQLELDAVQAEIDNATVDVSDLEAEKLELQKVADDIQKEIDSHQAAIDEIVSERESISPSEGDSGDDEDGEYDYEEPVPYEGGALGWPVASRMITSYFGSREAPAPGASTDHGALDIAEDVGEPIYASESGVCTNNTGWYYGLGLAVFIYHGEGVTTVYGHQSELLVSAGDYVKKGQVIGYVGMTGITTGPHVHYEVWLDGVKVDPLNYLE